MFLSLDSNDDGFLDFVTNDTLDGGFRIMLGDGTGNFGAAQSIPSGNNPTSIAFADIDSDGALDVIVGHDDAQTITTHRNLCPFCGDGIDNDATPCPEDIVD